MADNKDYEYSGMMARLWDFFRGDTSTWEDRFFFLEAVERYGQPVLDVGCGTGRILLDFLDQGIDIDGVDNSPEMLDLLNEKAEKQGINPNVRLQDMSSLDLPRKYQTILVPSSSFQLLTDIEEANQAIKKFYEYLLPGGKLVMPFMVLYTEQSEERFVEEVKPVREQVRPEDGVTMRRHSRSVYDLQEQLESTEDVYEAVKDGEVIVSEKHERSPATRWYTQEQAVKLYEDAGFTSVEVFSGFTWEPVKDTDTLFSIIGTRP